MLTRRDLAIVARREGISVGAVERDYLQHLLLRHVDGDRLAFKGGTCLRIALGSPRYSEDLDFTCIGDSTRLLPTLSRLVKALADYGIVAEFLEEEQHGADSLAGRFRYEGPLFDGSDGSRGTIWVDVSLRERVPTTVLVVGRTPYAEVPQLVLTCLEIEHLMAEKVRALLVRSKARDLFDVAFLLDRKVEAPRTLIDQKLAISAKDLQHIDITAQVRKASRDWERDLGVLLGRVPPLDQARSTVERYLAGL